MIHIHTLLRKGSVGRSGEAPEGCSQCHILRISEANNVGIFSTTTGEVACLICSKPLEARTGDKVTCSVAVMLQLVAAVYLTCSGPKLLLCSQFQPCVCFLLGDLTDEMCISTHVLVSNTFIIEYFCFKVVIVLISCDCVAKNNWHTCWGQLLFWQLDSKHFLHKFKSWSPYSSD